MKTLELKKLKPVGLEVFVFPEKKAKKLKDFFGKGKGIFGDALKYQQDLRKEWK